MKRIVIAGKNNMAVCVTKYIYEQHKDMLLGVICNKNDEGINKEQRSLRWFAEKQSIPVITLEDAYKWDDLILLSLEFDRLIKPELFLNAQLFNIHFSLLPKYKGMYTSAIPILNGEEVSGVTLHRIDNGIDTGEIIDQVQFSIKNMDCRELYFAYHDYGANLMLKNIENVIDGRIVSFPQSSIGSTYYSKKSVDYSNLIVDVNQTAENISRQIRAFSYREYQLPVVANQRIIDSFITNIRSVDKPGKVLLYTRDSTILSTVDYNICLYHDRFFELIKACKEGNVGLVKDICSVRKHLNAKDSHGWTPLIIATYHNRLEIAELLISMGADIHCKSNNGTNLLMYAKEAYKHTGDNSLFRLYIALGLNIYESDFNGKTLLDYIDQEKISVEEMTR